MPNLDFNALLTGGASAVVVLAGVVTLILRGQLVPGWVYQELRERMHLLEEQVPANTAALGRAVDAFSSAELRRSDAAPRRAIPRDE